MRLKKGLIEMEKKEILIILALTVLVTGLSGFYVVDRSSWTIELGLPLVYRVKNIVHPSWGGSGPPPSPGYFVTSVNLIYKNLVINFLFWFLVIFGIWQVVKWIKRK